MLRQKRSIYNFPAFDEDRYLKVIDDIFEDNNFKRHLAEVKFKLADYSDELIEDVIKFHIKKMASEISKIRPWKRSIFVHRWAKIEVFPLIFNPYSAYYDQKETTKQFRKYKKEFNQIFKTN